MAELIGGVTEAEEKALWDFSQKVFMSAQVTIEWCTVPMVHMNHEGKAVDHRTGILIEIANDRFLVTAAHGMGTHFDVDDVLFLLGFERGAHLIPLVRERFWSTVDDEEDISVTRLLPETVEAMGPNYRYLHLKDIIPRSSSLHGTGAYLLLGYPFVMVRPDDVGVKRADPWKYITLPFHGSYNDVSNYDPELHLILDYKRNSLNNRGEIVHPPGLSGCGVWLTRNPFTQPVFNLDDFKLVAIQTAWHKQHQYVKTTWINIVLLIIWKYYPETRAPMKLNGIDFTG